MGVSNYRCAHFTWMATTLICGFEMQSLGEVLAASPAASISTTVFRSGAASLRLHPTAAVANVTFQIRSTGGTLQAFAQSIRFYIRFDSLPGNMMLARAGAGVAAGFQLDFISGGALYIADGTDVAGVTSTNLFTADGVFHRVDVDSSGTTRTVYVDGVQWAQKTGVTGASPQTTFTLGTLTPATFDSYIDDLVVDDGSIGAPASGANNKTALLIPTAGNNAGGWTDGAGGTGDIHGSVDNIPPTGVLASTALAKIKNATSTTTGDYVATMQTYLVAGIPPGSIISAVQSIVAHGREVTTGDPKPGANWIASNPAQTAGTGTFDYGDSGVIEGTYPTGWPSHVGPVSVAPSVTLGTAPTVTVRKNLASTRVTGVCFMGMYVDYSPPPIGQIISTNQAVKRASLY